MRTALVIIWFIILTVLFVYVKKRFRLGMYGVIGLSIVAIVLWLGGSAFIDLNTIPSEVQEKVDQIVSVYGDTYIKTEGNDIYINVNNEWLNLSEIKLIGGLLTDDIYIEYEGREIYLGHSGVVNVFKTLESMGLIE